MGKIYTLLLASFFSVTGLIAQDNTSVFEIKAPKYQPQNSLYRRIAFLDSRREQSPIGKIGVGVFKNADANLILKTPVAPQLATLLDSLTDTTAATGELLFQLRRFRFVEESSTRYCYLCASLYARSGDGYRPLSSLDTLILLRTGNIKKDLTKAATSILTDFMAKTLMLRSNDSAVYTLADLGRIDSIEEARVPAYHTVRYVDGVYSSFEAFAKMEPDVQAVVDMRKNGDISSVKTVDSSGRKVKIDRKKIYAVINNGELFFVTEYGYYPAQVIGREFIFVGDVRVVASESDLVTGQIAFGLIGRAMAKAGSEAKYQLMVDHLNGRLVHLLELKMDTNE